MRPDNRPSQNDERVYPHRVMVVVGIIAALAAFAIQIIGLAAEIRLKDSIASLQSSLALARMIAMNQSTTVTVTLSQPLQLRR